MSSKLRAAGYGRVSTIAQVRDGTGKDEQVAAIEAVCKKEGWELVGFYDDFGISGKNVEDRPGIQRLIQDAEGAKFDVVVFTKLDRLARNVRELLNLWETLVKNCGVQLHCIHEPAVNSSGQLGKIMLVVLGLFADLEREWIRERMNGGRLPLWRNQQICIGQPPYGYRWNKEKKVYEIVPEQQKVYAKIVSLYVDSHLSLKDIALYLTREGIPTPSSEAKNWKTKSTRWNKITVQKILRSTAYKGYLEQNRFVHKTFKTRDGRVYMAQSNEEKPEEERIIVHLPPMISEERWQQIQRVAEYNKRKPKRKLKQLENRFLCNGLVYCGECGGKTVKNYKVDERGKERVFRLYYTCHWKRAGDKELELVGRERCILRSVDADWVDNLVLSQVTHVLVNPKECFEAWLRDHSVEELEKKVKRLRERKEQLESKLLRGYNFLTTTSDSARKLYEQQQKKDEEQLNEVETELTKAEKELTIVRSKHDRLMEFENTVKRLPKRKHFSYVFGEKIKLEEFIFSLPFEEKRRLVEAILAPELGGRVLVRYVRPSDYMEMWDEPMSEEELREPLIKRKRGQKEPGQSFVVELDFEFDLNRILAAITTLKEGSLLDKFDTGGVSRWKKDVNRRRRILQGNI